MYIYVITLAGWHQLKVLYVNFREFDNKFTRIMEHQESDLFFNSDRWKDQKYEILCSFAWPKPVNALLLDFEGAAYFWIFSPYLKAEFKMNSWHMTQVKLMIKFCKIDIYLIPKVPSKTDLLCTAYIISMFVLTKKIDHAISSLIVTLFYNSPVTLPPAPSNPPPLVYYYFYTSNTV